MSYFELLSSFTQAADWHNVDNTHKFVEPVSKMTLADCRLAPKKMVPRCCDV